MWQRKSEISQVSKTTRDKSLECILSRGFEEWLHWNFAWKTIPGFVASARNCLPIAMPRWRFESNPSWHVIRFLSICADMERVVITLVQRTCGFYSVKIISHRYYYLRSYKGWRREIYIKSFGHWSLYFPLEKFLLSHEIAKLKIFLQ